MALRSLYFVLALSLLIATGCRRTSNYQPGCCGPAAVAPACPPPCPPGQIPPPPGVLVPR
jgi:hypothetical protein